MAPHLNAIHLGGKENQKQNKTEKSSFCIRLANMLDEK